MHLLIFPYIGNVSTIASVENIATTTRTVRNVMFVALIMIVVVIFFVAQNAFNNQNKLRKVDASKVKHIISDGSLPFDDVSDNMLHSLKKHYFTSIISTIGIPFYGMDMSEQLNVKNAYVSFIRTITQPFQVFVKSSRIDIEFTLKMYEEKYTEAIEKYEAKKSNLDLLVNQNEVEKAKKEIKYLQNHIIGIEEQINYVSALRDKITGTTKEVYYSISSELESAAVEGLNFSEVKKVHSENLAIKAGNMISALSRAGIKARALETDELLDLGRKIHKPFTGEIFKTKDILENTNYDGNVIVNKGLHSELILSGFDLEEGENID